MILRKKYSYIFKWVVCNKMLLAILVLALALRFVGVYPGYHPYHSDEGMSYSSAIEMIRNLNLDPGRYDYPSLVPIIHSILYVVLFIPLFIVKSLILDPEDLPTKGKNIIELWQQVVIQNQQTAVLYWGRYVTAAFGVGVVFLTYLVAKSFFVDKRVGLAAAFLAAVNFRQVLNSHLGLPDIYNAFFLLGSLYFLSLIPKSPTTKNYLSAGIWSALYFSVKFQIFIIPAFLLTHIFSAWGRAKRKISIKLLNEIFVPKLFIATIVAALLTIVINYAHLINWEKFMAITSYNTLKYGVGTKVLNFFPISYLYHIGIGQIISVSILLGMATALRKNATKAIILLSVIISFMFVAVYYTRGGYYTRNFVTLTPILLIFAGVFWVQFWDYLGKKAVLQKSSNTRKYIVFFGLVASLFFASRDQIQNSIVSSYYFSKPWGFNLANKWAESNIPEGAVIVSHPWDKYPRDKNLKVVPFEVSTTFSLAEMQEEGASYGFLNMDWLALGSYWWMNRSTKESLDYWEKPNDLLANMYHAVVAQELAHFSVAKYVKPWQTPDMNFLLVKIPSVVKVKDRELVEIFAFDRQDALSSWSLIGNEQFKKFIFDSGVGRDKKGALKIDRGSVPLQIVRAVSPAIPIDSKKMIVIEGWIKSEQDLKKENRDGVLRVDFYSQKPVNVDLKTRSLSSNVSSRVFGTNDWVKRELVIFPPQQANFITVGIQVNGYSSFWLDDLKIFQSEDYIKDSERGQYINYRIPEDILFPYSQGGL